MPVLHSEISLQLSILRNPNSQPNMIGPLIELVLQLALGGVHLAGAIHDHSNKNRSRGQTSNAGRLNSSLDQLPPITSHSKAVLITSSTISFGNSCERLVNIAFHTSQTFPSIIATYADLSSYLRKELVKQYPDQYFHIVVGESRGFGFSVDDGEYFAEIEQERYRVVIFSTKQSDQTKSDSHDANSRMMLQWK